MFPDTAFKTTIHAVAVSEMYAIAVSKMPAADTTVGEGPSDKHAAAPLEAVAAGGMVVPDAATGSAGADAGADAGMPPRVASDVAGANTVERCSQLAIHTPPTAVQTSPRKATCYPKRFTVVQETAWGFFWLYDKVVYVTNGIVSKPVI